MSLRFSLVLLFVLLVALPVLPQDEEQPDLTVHVVQRGENLFRIALNYGLTAEAVAQANGITDPSSIQVGQRLIIPISGTPVNAAPPPEPQEHTVQPGESLMSIAELYQVPVEDIVALNELADPNSLFVGQVLQITAPIAETTVEEISPPSTANEAGVIHVVQPGETLFSIAQSYGSTVIAVQEANGITDPTLIYGGQEILIPDVEPPQIAVNLPEIITSLNINPVFLVEGRSGLISLTTATAATVTGQFLDRDLTIIPDETGTSHIAIVAIPIYTTAGIYPLNLQIGQTANISVNVQVLAGGYASQEITLPEDRLELLTPAVEENEINIIRSLTTPFNPERYFDGPMSIPAAAPMNSPFGTRRSYNGGPVDRYHNGADFAGAPGVPVVAAAPGRVVLSDTLNIRGLSIIIDHGWGVYTNYSHLSDRFVQIGDFVETGQVIGSVGSTGRATGAHLHWELWVNGVAVDPMQWVIQSFVP